MLVNWLMVIAFAYLGPSLLLSGIFATRGCEVRAVWQLVGKLLERETVEYPCMLLSSLVHLQDRFRLTSYSNVHENSNLRTFVVGR